LPEFIARIAKPFEIKKNLMLKAILRLYATLPLPVIHCSGWAVGWIMYLSDKKFARRLKKNLGLVRIADGAAARSHLARRCAVEIGKSVMNL